MPKRPLDPPIQTNILRDMQFKFEIDIFPHVSYHLRDIQLPSVSVDQPIFSTPHRDVTIPGSKIIFDPLTITFLVDDDLQNWKEIYYWLIGSTFKEHKYKDVFSDGTLHILNGDLTPKTSIKFINCHPTMIGDLTFDSGSTEPQSLMGLIMLDYDYYIFTGDDIL